MLNDNRDRVLSSWFRSTMPYSHVEMPGTFTEAAKATNQGMQIGVPRMNKALTSQGPRLIKERWQDGAVAFDAKGRQIPTTNPLSMLDPTASIKPDDDWKLHGKYGYMSCYPPLTSDDEVASGRLVSLGELVDWLMSVKGLPYREAVERLCKVLDQNSLDIGKWLYFLKEHDHAKKARMHDFSHSLKEDELRRYLDEGRVIASHKPGGPYFLIGVGALLHYIEDIWLGEIDDFGDLRNAKNLGDAWPKLKEPLYKTAILIHKAHELFDWGTATVVDDTKLHERAEAKEREHARRRYAICFLLSPIASGMLLSYTWVSLKAADYFFFSKYLEHWGFALGIGLLPITISLIVSPHHTAKNKHLAGWWISKCAGYVSKAFIALLLLALAAIFQGGIWDWVKAATGFNP